MGVKVIPPTPPRRRRWYHLRLRRFRDMGKSLPLVILGLAVLAYSKWGPDRPGANRPEFTRPQTYMIEALRYAHGEGVPRNDEKAFAYLRLAAEGGEPLAMFQLACYYEEGRGVERNLSEALKWWRQAAKQHHNREAMHNVGLMYERGEGVPLDLKESYRWYRAAAERGHAGAMFAVGAMHANGEGVERDYEEAYVWLLMAVDCGEAEAEGGLDSIRSVVPAEARTRARERADQLLAAMPAPGER